MNPASVLSLKYGVFWLMGLGCRRGEGGGATRYGPSFNLGTFVFILTSVDLLSHCSYIYSAPSVRPES